MAEVTYQPFQSTLIDSLNDNLGPTDFKISAKIIYADGNEGLELRPSITELSYYEDLFGNGCSGQLILSDSSNYGHEMSLCGDEFLKLQLYNTKDSSDEKKWLKKYFRIYKMGDRNLSKDANENYTLNFASEEIFLSEQYRVSKAYKARISQIVLDIAKNYLKIKPSELGYDPNSKTNNNVLPTLGDKHIIIPNLKPLEAINWLSTLAMCQDTRIKGASYLFYADKNGWHYKPFLAIYGDFKTYGRAYNSEANPYQYRMKNNDSEDILLTKDPDKSKNILSYQVMDNYNSFDATQSGMFANKLVWTDNFKRLHETETFDYEKYREQIKPLCLYKEYQPYGVMSDAINRKQNKHNEVNDTVLKMGFKTENNNINITIPHRVAQLALSSAIRMKIIIPGDTDLVVGTTIYVDLKAPAPVQCTNAEEKKKMDKLYSGWYLITALRHRVDQNAGFETTLELSKDSLLSSVSEMDNPGLKPFNNGSEFLQTARSGGCF